MHYMPMAVAINQAKQQLTGKASRPVAQPLRHPPRPFRRSSTPTDPRSSRITFAAMAKKMSNDIPALKKAWDTSSQATLRSGGATSSRANLSQRCGEQPVDNVKRVSTPEGVTVESSQGAPTAANPPQPSQSAVAAPASGLADGMQWMMDTFTAKLEKIEARLGAQYHQTQQQLAGLTGKVQELHDQRKEQLHMVAQLVQKNLQKPHDAVTGLAFQLVDALRETALGKPDAFMRTVFKLAPAELAINLGSPPVMPEDLHIALANVMGLTSTVQKNNA